MDDYTRMKLSEKLDEDCYELFDIELAEYLETLDKDSEAFTRKYKEFYTDIKISHKEDW